MTSIASLKTVLHRDSIDKDSLGRHLKVVKMIENIIKIRDYMINDKCDDDSTKRRLRAKSFTNVNGPLEFYTKVYEKIERDNRGDYGNEELVRFFDIGGLNKDNLKTYVHFNLSDSLNLEQINNCILKVSEMVDDHDKLIIIFSNSAPSIQERLEDREIKKPANTILSSIAKINTSGALFKKMFFNLNLDENYLFLINKMLVARQLLFEMVEVRKYYGIKTYNYYNGVTGSFGHFLGDLETRFRDSLKIEDDKIPLYEKNYFDITGLYRKTNTREIPIYIHFITKPLAESGFNDYISKLVSQIRGQILNYDGDKYKGEFHLILITHKKLARGAAEKFGQVFDEDIPGVSKVMYDIIQLDNLQYNPLKNSNQPKFTLIKKGSLKAKEILMHYGSTETVPRMIYRDPVNKFFGGEPGDIYEIVRPQIVKIQDNKHSQIHLDIAYRIVKG